MPVIQVDWTQNKSKEEKKKLIQNIVNCVSAEIKVPDEVVNVILHDIPEENVRFTPAILNISWSQTSDRNREAKKIIAKLTDIITETTDIRPEKVVFFFHDLEGENVGVAGTPRA